MYTVQQPCYVDPLTGNSCAILRCVHNMMAVFVDDLETLKPVRVEPVAGCHTAVWWPCLLLAMSLVSTEDFVVQGRTFEYVNTHDSIHGNVNEWKSKADSCRLQHFQDSDSWKFNLKTRTYNHRSKKNR